MSQPSASHLRRFGLTVGGVFVLIALVSGWRGHVWPPRILAVVGVSLVVPALVWPQSLARVERGWMAFAMALGHVNTRIILSVLYWVVITPVAVVRRNVRDPLDRRLGTDRPSHWIRRSQEPTEPERYRKQF